MRMVKRRSLPLIFLLSVFALACNKSSNPSTPANASQPEKHYQLKGKVVSIDKQGKTVNVDSEAIPGFMDAMVMPYQVKPESDLDKLHPGDVITADLISQDENAWLQNITVTRHASAPASK